MRHNTKQQKGIGMSLEHKPMGTHTLPTPFQRAVRYYTLPKVVHPITYGLIIAYAVCVVEALGAIAIGLLIGSATWLWAGIYAFIGIVAFGILVFLGRAMVNQVREQRALIDADTAAPEADATDPSIPDPFAENIWLRFPLEPTENGFIIEECSRRMPTAYYEVVVQKPGWEIEIKNCQTQHNLQLFPARNVRNRLRIWGKPRRWILNETENASETTLTVRSTLEGTEVRVRECGTPTFIVCKGGIYQGTVRTDALVGRTYAIPPYTYLDLPREICRPCLVAAWVLIHI
jgi:hypothetical protein